MILLMRHAEKTGNPDDIGLSPEGARRASLLPAYILGAFGKPTALIAAARSPRSDRSYLTLKPLEDSFPGLIFDYSVAQGDVQGAAEKIHSLSPASGGLVVVCWHHSTLPQLAATLGATGVPDPWDPTVFNLIIRLDLVSGSSPIVQQITEPF